MINILLQYPVAMDFFFLTIQKKKKKRKCIDLSYSRNRKDFAEAATNLTLQGKKVVSFII